MEGDPFAGVREALRHEQLHGFSIEHLDITCDGCDAEPIVGNRWVCSS